MCNFHFHFLKNKVGAILEFRDWTRFGNRIFINVHFEKMSEDKIYAVCREHVVFCSFLEVSR